VGGGVSCLCEICTTKEDGDTLQARNCTLLQALLKWWILVCFFICYLLSMGGGFASHLKQWVMRYGAEAYTSHNVMRSVFEVVRSCILIESPAFRGNLPPPS